MSGGVPSTSTVQLKPLKTQITPGHSVILDSAHWATPDTNGNFAVPNLTGGFYDANFGDPTDTFPVFVPIGDTNTYTIDQVANLAINASRFLGTNIGVLHVLGGTNILSVTSTDGLTTTLNLSSLAGTVSISNALRLSDGSGNARLDLQPTYDALNYPNGQTGFLVGNGNAQIWDSAGTQLININPGLFAFIGGTVAVGILGSSQPWTNTSTGQSWDWNSPGDSNTVPTQKWVTNTVQILTTNGANIAITTNANGALVIAVTGLGTAAFQNTGAFAQTANNGGDFGNLMQASSNISVIGISNQTDLFPSAQIPNVSGIPVIPGHLLVTYGQGNNGNEVHMLFIGTTNSGAANWNGGLEIPGALVAYSTKNQGWGGTGSSHALLASNANNILELVQYNNTPGSGGYSSIGFADQSNHEQFAIGYGLSNSVLGKMQDVVVLSPIRTAIVFCDSGGKPFFGMEGSGSSKWATYQTFGDFVRWSSSSTNTDQTNVVFRVEGDGTTIVGGQLTVSNNATMLGNLTTIGSNGGQNNNAGISGSQVSINTSGSISSPSILNRTGSLFQYLNFSSDGSLQLGKYNAGTQADIFESFKGDHSSGFILPSMAIGGTNAPGSGSVLDLQGTSGGFLPPRMTKTQRNAISSPAAGMVVFQTDNTAGLRAWNGTHWVKYTETNDD